ncbi:hypothetical protein KGF54_001586 [Candida jiufengensis]|uniref:uncharacterized protein n=1 Tax=Candida jiufengensis TaxID=497108 RepID=UPI002224B87A|nr:uncharacterized protein KGF54_001586 [Candida jiufengensis]KAI5955025.1 hypothetical protein KGF54_001586 [Candida jiufengensis]
MSDISNQELIDQFKLITGFESSESSDTNEGDDIDSKILRLLTIHDYNLNNSISTYFDTGFESIGNVSIQEEATTGASSSVDPREIEGFIDDTSIDNNDQEYGDIGELIHRSSSSNTRSEFVNLQTQMFMNSMMPRLPKAPTIPMRWQLDVGIYSSILHDREIRNNRQPPNKEGVTEDEKYEYKDKLISSGQRNTNSMGNSSIINALWFILLIIPKSFLQLLLSSVKYIFGIGGWKDDIGGNNFSAHKSFKYDENFDPNYSFIKHLHKHTDTIDHFKKFNNLKDSNFNDIHQHCQKEYDWLLVILTNDSHENQNFIHTLFNNSNFQKNFNSTNGTYKNVQIYLGNIDHQPESFEIAKTYKIKKLPYLMLISNVSSSPEIMASMSIVYKSNISINFIETSKDLKITIPKIIKNLIKNIEKFNPQLVSAKYDKQEMEFSRMIRKQQDDAYSESLVKDQIKKQEKTDQLLKESRIKSLKNLKLWFINSLINDEFLNSTTVDKSNNASNLKIAIKLPNGKRIIENLNPEITILQFYIFIELKLYQESEKLLAIEDLESLQIDDEYKYKYSNHIEYFEDIGFKFDVIQPYPKKVIGCDSNVIIGDVPEFRGANFLVEYHHEDEDDTEEEDDIDL